MNKPDFSAIIPYAVHFSRPLEDVVGDLESYANLLRKWQKVQNLVSRETLDAVWQRHFADSLQLLKVLSAEDKLVPLRVEARTENLCSSSQRPARPASCGR
jgi:hypothetical protein